MTEFKIAVCDDEKAQLDKTIMVLDKIQKESEIKEKYNVSLRFKPFLSGRELLENLTTTRFDAFILDVQMEPINGLELAQEIRQKYNGEVPVVLLTAFPEFSIDGYKVRALRYILKDTMEKGLKEALPYLINKTENTSSHYTKLENGLRLPAKPDYIYYFESEGHYIRVYYHNYDGERYDARIRGALSDLAEKLASYDFVRCHRSYIVNVRKIQEIRPDKILIIGGSSIPLSRHDKTKVTVAYSKFQ